MGFLNIMGNSFGCSASGERLVSAARDGDLHEAKAILDCNPRLARYSTFGLRNSPLHHSAAQGHNEIVVLFLESGVDIDLPNASGQTALMQACQYGHWEVVQTLILFNANIHKTDYLNGGTAIHFAALNGHSRCIRFLLTDYVPSKSNFWDVISNNNRSPNPKISDCGFDESGLFGVTSKPADGGITALHMASLNGHAETVQLLLDLGGSVSAITVEDGTTVDLIGGGSTPLHYAACGGNAMCSQLLIARGASLDAQNANGSTPLNVARSWHRTQLEDVLSKQPDETQNRIHINPSPYLSLPLMSIMKIARESVCHEIDKLLTSLDPCVVCLERKCTVATEGCGHEFCTRCALYLCSTTSITLAPCPPAGSIPCPLCRHPIISFSKLPSNATPPKKLLPRPSGLALAICGTAAATTGDSSDELCKPSGFNCTPITPSLGSSLFRSLSCHRCPCSSMKLNPILCLGAPVTDQSLVRCPRPRLHRSLSHGESRSRWLFSFNQYEETDSD